MNLPLDLSLLSIPDLATSIPEVNCGIICGCLPILPAFFQHLSQKWFGNNYKGHPIDSSPSNSKLTGKSSNNFSHVERANPNVKPGTNDLEMDEAALIGNAYLPPMTDVRGGQRHLPASASGGNEKPRGLDKPLPIPIPSSARIVKKVDIDQQTFVRDATDDRWR